MNKTYKIAWSDSSSEYERTLNSLESLLAFIHELSDAPNQPTLLLIWELNTCRELGVGLGRERTVFTYQESLDPPYFISEGDAHADGETWFCYGQEQTEYLKANLVSASLIEPTVREFIGQLGRPRTVAWEKL